MKRPDMFDDSLTAVAFRQREMAEGFASRSPKVKAAMAAATARAQRAGSRRIRARIDELLDEASWLEDELRQRTTLQQADVVAEVAFLRGQGRSLDSIAAGMGARREALQRMLTRAGRADLARVDA